MKKKLIPALSVMLVLALCAPVNAVSDTEDIRSDNYNTDTSVTNYGVVDNGVMDNSNMQTEFSVLNNMRQHALYPWSYSSPSSYWYYYKYNGDTPATDIKEYCISCADISQRQMRATEKTGFQAPALSRAR